MLKTEHTWTGGTQSTQKAQRTRTLKCMKRKFKHIVQFGYKIGCRKEVHAIHKY